MSQSIAYPVASGPVIIRESKVLLVREDKDGYKTPWMFPGGGMEETDETIEAACIRECKEETGLDIRIIKPLRTLLSPLLQQPDQKIILAHYLAEADGEPTIPDNDVVFDVAWHNIDNLPENCAPNVIAIIDDIHNSQFLILFLYDARPRRSTNQGAY